MPDANFGKLKFASRAESRDVLPESRTRSDSVWSRADSRQWRPQVTCILTYKVTRRRQRPSSSSSGLVFSLDIESSYISNNRCCLSQNEAASCHGFPISTRHFATLGLLNISNLAERPYHRQYIGFLSRTAGRWQWSDEWASARVLSIQWGFDKLRLSRIYDCT